MGSTGRVSATDCSDRGYSWNRHMQRLFLTLLARLSSKRENFSKEFRRNCHHLTLVLALPAGGALEKS